jgi:hypothetical protein
MQGLAAPVTDLWRLRYGGQRLYLCCRVGEGHTTVLGGLKVGAKRLFIRRVGGGPAHRARVHF